MSTIAAGVHINSIRITATMAGGSVNSKVFRVCRLRNISQSYLHRHGTAMCGTNMVHGSRKRNKPND